MKGAAHMNGWGIAALVVLAVPCVVTLVWIVREQRSAKRWERLLARHQERSVAGIQARVEREREEERNATADTQVLPVLWPARPPEPLQMPKRVRRYPTGRPTPYPRRPLTRPDADLMGRVLGGLRELE
jgi:hypothetical protein